ncbi:MAG TPA: hypothetical protein VGN88_09190 [Phycisphaerae bacterium]
MRQRLIVAQDSVGHPTAQVPFACMWNLVEYLSYQRVFVTYQYEASHFTVTFPKMDVESAQRVLDEWDHVSNGEELQTA